MVRRGAVTTATQRNYRDHAASLKRALLAEKRKFGGFDDGDGNRYVIGPLYVLAGALDEAVAYYKWFERNFADDTGDPLLYVYWSLALYRSGAGERANSKLLETMLQNVYLLPDLVGLPSVAHDVWHGSNLEMPDYPTRISPEFRPVLSEQERVWITAQLESARFRRVLTEYVSAFHALKGERDVRKRQRILRQWDTVWKAELEGSRTARGK